MYSFDVFDTLIMRTTATPWGIFALMRDRIKKENSVVCLDKYVIDNFYELRIHSEELARKALLCQRVEEVTLYDIYEAMALCGGMSKEQIQYLYNLEQVLEIENVIGISENIEKVKTISAQGERVVLVSDMYLPKETIRRMLVQADGIFGRIPLYVSSEYRKRKTTGNLYRCVKEIEQVDYKDWIHIGDNLYQDVEISFQLGIEPELARRTELTAFERKQLDYYGDDSRLQLMIGTARNLDKENVENDSYHIGCRYAGPVLYSYAEWIVTQVEKKGIQRLYFIARDGYLVKKIVDMILESRKLDIVTSYIYGSRAAWRMPSLSKEHYNLYQLILWSHVCKITTLEELASVLHVPLQELYDYLPGTFAKAKENNCISQRELEYIMTELSASESFKEYHLQKLQKEKEIVQKYLFQEIDISDDRFAFVDVSGGGLTQGCLWELMKERCHKPIHTFFFKIDRVNLSEGSVTDTFIPSFLENNLTIEMMCRAPHGSTKSYMVRSNKIEPVLGDMESRALIEHGFYEYEKGILDFSQEMLDVSQRIGIKIASMRNVLLYLQHIAEEPSKDVLEYFASMPSSETGRDQKIIEYAPKLTKEEIKEIFLTRGNNPIEFFYKGTDLNYSIMRATDEEKALIEFYKKESGRALGRVCRQEVEKDLREVRHRYKRASNYPIRLLEEKIVLYGAGKFGQDLYNRLIEDVEHEIILWVDKKADECQQQGLTNVHCVSDIKNVDYNQIVIAVMDEKLADSIKDELERTGIDRKKMIWFHPNQAVEWKAKGIG